jgi:hypothetical protein
MKKMKKILIFVWIAVQILALAYFWFAAIAPLFSHRELPQYINPTCCIYFFALDLWTAKFLKELPKNRV